MKLIVFFLTTLFVLPIAFAGQEKGGGHGVVCTNPNGSIKSLELLDYYEWENSESAQLDLGPVAANYHAKIKFVLDRLSNIDPVAASRFKTRALKFDSEMKLINDAQMPTVGGDSHEIINPDRSCYKARFAVQVFNPKEGQKRYWVNRDLWNVADETTKAGLILHEIIYKDAVEIFNQDNSDLVRYYNFMISSTEMNGIDAKKYGNILYGAKFTSNLNPFAFSTKINGFTFYQNGDIYPAFIKVENSMVLATWVELDRNGNVTAFTPAQGGLTGQAGLTQGCGIDSNGPRLCIDYWTIPNGISRVYPLSFSNTFGLKILPYTVQVTVGGVSMSVLTVLPDHSYHFTDYPIQVYPSGHLKSAMLSTSVKVNVYGGQEITLKPEWGTFFENGMIKLGTIQTESGLELTKQNGTKAKLKAKTAYIVNFDETGKLVNYRDQRE
jgi:hypothetical protein